MSLWKPSFKAVIIKIRNGDVSEQPGPIKASCRVPTCHAAGEGFLTTGTILEKEATTKTGRHGMITTGKSSMQNKIEDRDRVEKKAPQEMVTISSTALKPGHDDLMGKERAQIPKIIKT
jgi:hypothetical protein